MRGQKWKQKEIEKLQQQEQCWRKSTKRRKEKEIEKKETDDVCRYPECDEEYNDECDDRYGLNVSHATNGTNIIVQHNNLMIT